ncbi:MAG: hypothetical protein GY861_06300 [bacterium]|nr:hypothetical protein [bacterium]
MNKQGKVKLAYNNLLVLLLVAVLALTAVNAYKINDIQVQIAGEEPEPSTPATPVEQPVRDVKIDFYIMSHCPYGIQAVQGIAPVYEVMKDDAEFNPHYVIYANYRGGGPDYCVADGAYCSMHGIQELNQGVRELCVDKYMGTQSYFEFTLAMMDACNSRNADTCWEPIAEGLGLDVDVIKTCEAEDILEILAEEKALNDALEVRGSPTIFINDEKYSGQRTPAAYQTAMCGKFTDAPESCAAVMSDAGAEVTGSC